MTDRIIRVSGCHVCVFKEKIIKQAPKCIKLQMYISQYDCDKTIHPDCPLERQPDQLKHIRAVVEEYKEKVKDIGFDRADIEYIHTSLYNFKRLWQAIELTIKEADDLQDSAKKGGG